MTARVHPMRARPPASARPFTSLRKREALRSRARPRSRKGDHQLVHSASLTIHALREVRSATGSFWAEVQPDADASHSAEEFHHTAHGSVHHRRHRHTPHPPPLSVHRSVSHPAGASTAGSAATRLPAASHHSELPPDMNDRLRSLDPSAYRHRFMEPTQAWRDRIRVARKRRGLGDSHDGLDSDSGRSDDGLDEADITLATMVRSGLSPVHPSAQAIKDAVADGGVFHPSDHPNPYLGHHHGSEDDSDGDEPWTVEWIDPRATTTRANRHLTVVALGQDGRRYYSKGDVNLHGLVVMSPQGRRPVDADLHRRLDRLRETSVSPSSESTAMDAGVCPTYRSHRSSARAWRRTIRRPAADPEEAPLATMPPVRASDRSLSSLRHIRETGRPPRDRRRNLDVLTVEERRLLLREQRQARNARLRARRSLAANLFRDAEEMGGLEAIQKVEWNVNTAEDRRNHAAVTRFDRYQRREARRKAEAERLRDRRRRVAERANARYAIPDPNEDVVVERIHKNKHHFGNFIEANPNGGE